MDEQKVTELFRAAAGDAPPASFDEHDVAARSRRVTLRRRSMLAGGSGVAVVVLAVGLLLGTGVFGHTLRGGTPSAAGALAQSTQQGAEPFAQHSLDGPGSAGPALRGPTNFPATSPVQGGGGAGGVGPGAGGILQGCGPTDRELAVALASALPSVGAPAVPPESITACDSTMRTASYLVTDGQHSGYVTAMLDQHPDGNGFFMTPGSHADTGVSASGKWHVSVVVAPASPGQVPPLVSRLPAIMSAVSRAF